VDLYTILGLSRVASSADIKRAYKRLARRFHPDINPGDGTAVVRFRQITHAYETLSDPDRRRRYDVSGHDESTDVADFTYGFEGFDFSVRVGGAQAPTFGDLFAEMFGQAQSAPGRAPERGVDLHATASVSFEDALRGVDASVGVTRQEACRMCGGAGAQRTTETTCRHCGGEGHIRSTRGHMVFAKPCRPCGGSGRLNRVICPGCRGSGLEARAETVAFAVPPGTPDGLMVRVSGKGHAGRLGGPPGDLHVQVHVERHPLIRREGDDLLVTVPVAVHEAALGARIDIPALDGSARVRVPPGTQSGQRFRVRGRGAPSLRDGTRGDLIVEVRLALPRILDERSKELLREFGRVNSEDLRADLLKPR